MSSPKVLQRGVCLLLALLALPAYSFDAPRTAFLQTKEVLSYGVEWRLIRAGTARVEWNRGAGVRSQINVHVESVGLVSKLFRVDDNFSSNYEDSFCAVGSSFRAIEGFRKRETRINYNRSTGRADYTEHDLVKNSTTQRHIQIPSCVHDVLGGLYNLRTLPVEPGQSVVLPISDGKKSISARVDAREREEIKTPAGTYKTIRYEANLFNGQLYERKGKLDIWVTDDARRLPVQIRIRLAVSHRYHHADVREGREIMKPSRFIAALLPMVFCAALAQQPASSPILSREKSLELYERDLQLMESLSIAIPELARAGAPIMENVRAATGFLRDSSGWAHTPTTYRLLLNLRAFVALADAVDKPFPFPEEALRQLTELRISTDRVNAHFRAVLEQREAILRSPDRDNTKRYAEADARLAPPVPGKPRVVFLGDSITDGWRINEYFPDSDFINRGISGQITGEMLARMKQDVIDLKPAAVLILAGTNDIGRGNRAHRHPEQPDDDCRTWPSTTRSRPIFASLLPVADYHQPQTRRRPPEQIRALNQWLQQFCAKPPLHLRGLLLEGGGCQGLPPGAAVGRRSAPQQRRLPPDGARWHRKASAPTWAAVPRPHRNRSVRSGVCSNNPHKAGSDPVRENRNSMVLRPLPRHPDPGHRVERPDFLAAERGSAQVPGEIVGGVAASRQAGGRLPEKGDAHHPPG